MKTSSMTGLSANNEKLDSGAADTIQDDVAKLSESGALDVSSGDISIDSADVGTVDQKGV